MKLLSEKLTNDAEWTTHHPQCIMAGEGGGGGGGGVHSQLFEPKLKAQGLRRSTGKSTKVISCDRVTICLYSP